MRDWWLRALLVLQKPRPVFVALRDNDAESLGDRSEPVLAIVGLAGMATVLSSTTAGHLIDDGSYDGLLVAVWAFIAVGIYGAVAYFALGGCSTAASRRSARKGRTGAHDTCSRSRRCRSRSRSCSGPVKLALYGEDVFRSGGTTAVPVRTPSHPCSASSSSGSVALLVIGCDRSTAGRGRAAVAGSAAAIVVPVLLFAVSTYL